MKTVLLIYLIYWTISGLSYCFSTILLYETKKSVFKKHGIKYDDGKMALLIVHAYNNFKEAYIIKKKYI